MSMTFEEFADTYMVFVPGEFGARIDLTDLSHSFPFVHLSRKFGVRYDAILALASAYDGDYLHPPAESEPHSSCARAVYEVCHAPWRWQFPPEGRGL